jgi:ribosome-binding factor A
MKIAGIVRTIAATYALQIPPNVASVVSITDVKVSSDLSYADIHVSALSGEQAAVKFLASRASEMRRDLSSDIQAFRSPILRFSVDVEGKRAQRLDELLEKISVKPEAPAKQKKTKKRSRK